MTSAARDWVDYPHGTVATVEGRLAVMVRPRNSAPRHWDWLDGTWTSIPITEPVVIGNVYALPLVDALIEALRKYDRCTGESEAVSAWRKVLAARDALEAALRGEGQ